MVCVKGLNPTGSVFIAQRLVTHVPAAPAAAAATAAAKQQLQTPPTAAASSSASPLLPLSMVVAAGPFTTSDNMQYEPLEELLKYCSGGCGSGVHMYCTAHMQGPCTAQVGSTHRSSESPKLYPMS